MNVHSSTRTSGRLLRNLTCCAYASGPLMASKFETMCSIRNAPIGTMPVSECRRRQKKLWPSPARSGCTPLSGADEDGAGGVAVAIRRSCFAGTQGVDESRHDDYSAAMGERQEKAFDYRRRRAFLEAKSCASRSR